MAKGFYIFCVLATLHTICNGAFLDIMSKGPLNDEALAQQHVIDIMKAMERMQSFRFGMAMVEVKNKALSSEDMTPINFISGLIFEDTLLSADIIMKMEDLKQMQYKSFTDPNLVRQIGQLLELFGNGLTDIEYERMREASKKVYTLPGQLVAHYNKTMKSSMSYDKALIMMDYDYQLEYLWMHSRMQMRQELKQKYADFVALYRKQATALGYVKPSDMFFKDLDTAFPDMYNALMDLKPFYMEFHAYIRHHIRQKYGVTAMPLDNKPIPEVYLNKFLLSLLEPYTTSPFVAILMPNPEEYMRDADSFFASMNMSRVPLTFWQNAVKNTSRTCDTKLYYAGDSNEFAMSYCWSMPLDTAYDKFSDIQYILQSEQKNFLERAAMKTNLNFALTKAIVLSAKSWNNVRKFIEKPFTVVDKTKYYEFTMWQNLIEATYLLPTLSVANFFIADGLDGTIRFNDNCEYWNYMQNMTGIVPPRTRTSDDFDMYIHGKSGNLEDIPSALAQYILSFQIYAGLCSKSGATFDTTPTGEMILSSCDFSTSAEAAAILKSIMTESGSRDWMEVMTEYLGITQLSIEPMLKYFDPIYQEVREFNTNNNITSGWEDSYVCANTLPNVV